MKVPHKRKSKQVNDPQGAFGARVRYLRLKAGLSQEELADQVGLDRTYVGGIERGERNPALKNIVKLAEALGVPPVSLFEEWENEHAEISA
jgi:transcriptional regulator with XRE-family HTH domain